MNSHVNLRKDKGNPIILASHPGWTATDLQRYSGVANFMNIFLGQKVNIGALGGLRAATDQLSSQMIILALHPWAV